MCIMYLQQSVSDLRKTFSDSLHKFKIIRNNFDLHVIFALMFIFYVFVPYSRGLDYNVPSSDFYTKYTGLGAKEQSRTYVW